MKFRKLLTTVMAIILSNAAWAQDTSLATNNAATTAALATTALAATSLASGSTADAAALNNKILAAALSINQADKKLDNDVNFIARMCNPATKPGKSGKLPGACANKETKLALQSPLFALLTQSMNSNGSNAGSVNSHKTGKGKQGNPGQGKDRGHGQGRGNN